MIQWKKINCSLSITTYAETKDTLLDCMEFDFIKLVEF